MIGPLEIVHDQTIGTAAHNSFTSASNCSASAVGTSSLAPGSDLAPQQRDDGFLSRIVRWLTDPQPVQDGKQWQRLAEFVTGAPEHLAAPVFAASAQAARTSVDLPMPGSPSISTAWPCPAVA